MALPEPIIAILVQFESLFSNPSYRKMLHLLLGTVVARGRRTVSTALKQLGLSESSGFSKYHHLLNRSKWSGLKASSILLKLVVATFLPNPTTEIEIVLDETLERRWGKKIKKRCHWRDSLASGKGRNVTTSGLRWLVGAINVKLAWSKRRWALPFVSLLLLLPTKSTELGLKHKTLLDRAIQLVKWLRRSLPHRPIRLLGDGLYSAIHFGLACQKQGITLVTSLLLNAQLYAPPEPKPGGRGAKPKIGQRLPKLSELLTDPKTIWQSLELNWYNQQSKTLDYCTGTALWKQDSKPALALRWVLVRDPKARLSAKAYCSTNLADTPQTILEAVVRRWNIEVTFEECRAHLGIETQRQWSDKAIERTTPVLLGLFSLVVLFGNALHPDGQIPLFNTAWYQKSGATFSDVLARVRRALWGEFNFPKSPFSGDSVIIPRSILDRFVFALCF